MSLPLPKTLPLESVEPVNIHSRLVTFSVPATVPAQVVPRIQTEYYIREQPDPKFNYRDYLNATKVTDRYIPSTFALTPNQQSMWQ